MRLNSEFTFSEKLVILCVLGILGMIVWQAVNPPPPCHKKHYEITGYYKGAPVYKEVCEDAGDASGSARGG